MTKTKTAKTPKAEKAKTIRITETRKAITKELRALDKARTVLTKAQAELVKAAEVATDKAQLQSFIAQIEIGTQVLSATVETQAQALARTFVK